MIRFFIFGLAGILLVGCSQFSGLSDKNQAQQQWLRWQQTAQQIEQWDVHARAIIILPGEVYHVGIRWQRDRQAFVILLEAPFGQGVFRVEAVPGSQSYRLRLPDGQTFSNRSAEALLDEVLGWSIPVSGLEFWIRGLPRPGSEYSHRIKDDGHLKSIQQDSWSIDYQDYFSPQDSPGLPRKLQLARRDLTLKLVIERWQLAETEQTPSDLFPEFN